MIEFTNRGCGVFVSEYFLLQMYCIFFPNQNMQTIQQAAAVRPKEPCSKQQRLSDQWAAMFVPLGITWLRLDVSFSLKFKRTNQKKGKKMLTDVDSIYGRNISKYKIISQITKRCLFSWAIQTERRTQLLTWKKKISKWHFTLLLNLPVLLDHQT